MDSNRMNLILKMFCNFTFLCRCCRKISGSMKPSFIYGMTENNRESKIKRERERDDAVRAIIDARTTWIGARHLRPFSLPVPALTDCHRHH